MKSSGQNVILHIGIGSFHRAHQAWYLHRLIEAGHTDWSIAAGSIRSDMTALLNCLSEQHGEYTLETVTPAGIRNYERVRSIRRVVPWEEDLAELIQAGADPNTRIVSFTVTESGYYLDDRHRLDPRHADLRTDLGGGRVTIYGTINAILRRRRESGAGPVTLLNCDNLRSNGDRFRDGLLEFLELRGERELRQWVLQNASFPNSMVDRITPRPSDEVGARVLAATGVSDGCPVMAESYIQWVIEDHFRAGRPPWEEAGAEIVASVLPYEEAKIRILNATHACIAWAGTLAGGLYIHEGTADPRIRKIAFDYVTDDAIPCLSPSPIDLAAYRDLVLERFSNPYIQDTNQRVAADGYSKILGWVVPTLNELLARDADITSTAALPALFFLFLQRRHRSGLPFEYRDGVMDEAAVRAMFDAPDPLQTFCEDAKLWGTLAGSRQLCSAIARQASELAGRLVSPTP